jgi:ParB-like chromosome segregation protein Spo0J
MKNKNKALRKEKILLKIEELFKSLLDCEDKDKIEIINSIKLILVKYSPFSHEPVDCILWIPIDEVHANDYNPNAVAPPEMKLLEHSIREDGFTQPIVAWRDNGIYEVVDGFHRNRVGRETEDIKLRMKGYLPLTVINESREDRGDRIAATIRHNRARGKHQVNAMSEIVVELKRRNWSDKKIGKELGMDPDEVLRLCQITGLAEMFADKEFSEAWEADVINEDDNINVDDEEIEK